MAGPATEERPSPRRLRPSMLLPRRPEEGRGSTRSERWSGSRILSTYFLLLLTLLLVVVFSITLPDSFPTEFNVRSLLSTRSIICLLALAVMVPLAANQFDLSVAYGMGLAHVLAIGLIVKDGVSWELAVVLVLLMGVVLGLVNGLLVTLIQVDSFIATLATGTFCFGLANWYTQGEQISGAVPDGFSEIATTTFASVIPLSAVIVAVVAVALWLILEFRPVGRRLLAIGANENAARLVGIRTRRYVVCAFVASGLLTATAGIVFASQLQAANSSTGPEFLLPAFVGALLGATSVRPGRVNVWGTVTAVALLGVGFSGLTQAGAEFYVEPLFNGITLAVAVGAAGYAARRRLHRKAEGDVVRRAAERERESGGGASTSAPGAA
jgi:ribose transport system permease protein